MTQILKVLDCRNDLVMEDYSRVAAELAQTNNAQNNTLNIIARATKRDSRMMKVLTVIAIAYVPASVIAVRYPFSSLNFQSSD
jgi:Mg2+ and Co2+ transporter CorA